MRARILEAIAAIEPDDSPEQLPDSPIVPDYEELSRNAHGELAAEWVPALDEGWRQDVASPR